MLILVFLKRKKNGHTLVSKDEEYALYYIQHDGNSNPYVVIQQEETNMGQLYLICFL